MGWYEALKDVVTVANRLRDAELQSRLAAVQVECAKLAEENARLLQELLELKQQAQIRQEMHYRDNVYWREVAGASSEGPFCPKCLDGSHKAVRLTDLSDTWHCPVCNWALWKPNRRR